MEEAMQRRDRWSIRPGVAGFVRDAGGRVLLHRRRVGGGWAPPSGAVEPGESLLAALRRELREETGLEVAVERLVGIYSDPSYQIVRYPDGRSVHFVTALFACQVQPGPVRGSDEGIEWQWFLPDRLPRDLLPYAQVWLRDALAGSHDVAVR
jgi:8-oxo-dGTP pyrophosphatase MutT (NUDIX family)